MAMLNFRHGLHSKLIEKDVNGQLVVPVSNGTIYVTTDEKAMYVDLNDSRIRLGQIVTLEDVSAWQAMQPPYSEEAFYYIAKENALIKYTGLSDEG
jgi:hypothetical protein